MRDITANVVSRLGHLSEADLIEATHAEGPWKQATNGGLDIANQVISHKSLVDHFSTEPSWVREMRKHVCKHGTGSLDRSDQLDLAG